MLATRPPPPKLSLICTGELFEFVARLTKYTSSLVFPCYNAVDPYNDFSYRGLFAPHYIAIRLSYLWLLGLDSSFCVCSHLLPKHVHTIGLTRCESHTLAVSALG